jgi:hypothetical protein
MRQPASRVPVRPPGRNRSRHPVCTALVGGRMTDKKPTDGIDNLPEINPDGADLDGTAEIERQDDSR